MLNAIEAMKYATKQELSDTAKFRAHCEKRFSKRAEIECSGAWFQHETI